MKSEWISVNKSKKKPKNGQKVYVTINDRISKGRAAVTDTYANDRFLWYGDQVIAWMPKIEIVPYEGA